MNDKVHTGYQKLPHLFSSGQQPFATTFVPFVCAKASVEPAPLSEKALTIFGRCTLFYSRVGAATPVGEIQL
jgi:hypothetical protein